MTRATRILRDTLATFEAAGHPVRGLRLYPDGTIDLLTEAPPMSPIANDDVDWVDLAGQTKASSAQGA